MGESMIQGLRQAIARAQGEPVPVRLTMVEQPVVDGDGIDPTEAMAGVRFHG